MVDTVGFNDKFWFDYMGHPHTEKLHTIERYTRTDLGTMAIEVTIDDPGAYAKPFTTVGRARIMAGTELMEYICQEENTDVEHLSGPALGPGGGGRQGPRQSLSGALLGFAAVSGCYRRLVRPVLIKNRVKLGQSLSCAHGVSSNPPAFPAALASVVLLVFTVKRRFHRAVWPPAVPVSVAEAVEESVPNQINANGGGFGRDPGEIADRRRVGKGRIYGRVRRTKATCCSKSTRGRIRKLCGRRRRRSRAIPRRCIRPRPTWPKTPLNRKAWKRTHRYAQLAKEGITSRSQNEQTQAAAETNRGAQKADQAAIDSARASIDSDRSADTAKLNLSYCDIHSLITGRAGNVLVHQGNLIGANGSALVVIHKLEPIWVSFGVPEDQLPASLPQ